MSGNSESSQAFLPFDRSAHDVVVIEPRKRGFGFMSFTQSPETTEMYGNIAALFERQGWCIIQLPEKIITLVQELQPHLLNFFSQPEEAKIKSSVPPQFGYSNVDHKEGIRFLTGSIFGLPSTLPTDLISKAVELGRFLDEYSQQIALDLAKPVFGLSGPALALHADLPVAYSNHRGMCDFALYHNARAGLAPPEMGESVDEVNCVPHFDPGLLSLSIFSNVEGLQLLDPSTNQWYAAPLQKDLGVLWLGAAAVKASKGRFKPAIHRVIYPKQSGPRLTMWYEMCTVEQINGPADKMAPADGQVEVSSIKGGGKMMTISKGETDTMILRRIERRRGLPMSKVARIDDSFKAFGFVEGFDDPEKYKDSKTGLFTSFPM